jgi:hypothetical protein
VSVLVLLESTLSNQVIFCVDLFKGS